MISTDITKTISQFIENQFPALYREEGQVLVAFVTAYYEYLEESGQLINRDMFTIRDIDTTLDDFISFFRNKYIEGFPFITSTDTRFLIKNIIDFYQAKGSDESIKLLMKLLFNDEVKVYYPSDDILRASDSLWINPVYLEVSYSTRTKTYLNKRIVGSVSGSSAFVESIVTKRVAGKVIDVLYLSSVRGDFTTGEFISDDGKVKNAPKIIGSLSDLEVDIGGSGYKVGDRLNVISPDGKNGIARITEVLTKNDAAQFSLVDGGFGYTLDSDTQVYVSTAMLFCDNPELGFKEFELVTQSLERLTLDPSGNTTFSIGDTIFGFNPDDVQIGEGRVVKITGDIITLEVDSGSFARTFELELAEVNRFFENEEIKEGNEVEIQFADATGSFINGERLLQRELDGEVNINVATGRVDIVDGSILYVNEGFGDFLQGKMIEGLTSGTTATISEVTVTNEGNRGLIIGASNTGIIVLPDTGEFSANTKIRGERSKNINEVVFVTETGLDYITSGNTVINVTAYENVSATGFVVGQNAVRVGLYGNTNPFIYVSGTENYIRSSETAIEKELTRVGFGSGASFEVGSLVPDTEETFIYNKDIIDSENVVGINYLDIFVDGVGSNISRVSDIIVTGGGSGYSNTSTVSFLGGGYLGGEPLIEARASVETNEFGEIIDIVVTDGGQGYFETPEILISDGAGANVEVQVEFGYGFPDNPYGGYYNVISDVWTEREVTLGEIFSLQRINQGANYDAGVFTKVVNSNIRKFNIHNLKISIGDQVGTFALGEVVENIFGYKARISAFENSNIVILKPLSFMQELLEGEEIVGLTSAATATVTSIEIIETSPVMGENAQVNSLVILTDGIIVRAEIIDSGFGYKDGKQVQLFDPATNQLVTTARSVVEKQGKSLGFWQTTTSHLNDKKLRDNFFYQEYSYQVIASLSFDKYERILRDLVHVSGSELFGAVEKKIEVNAAYDNTSYISKGTVSETVAELIGSLNIMNVPFADINLDPPFNSGVGRINTTIEVIDGGSGYSNNSVVQFIGGGGESGLDEPTVSAQASVLTDNAGSIISIGVTNRGEGYTAEPTVSISGGVGVDLVVSIDYGYGFVRNPYSTIDSIINQTLGGDGDKIFTETEVVYETIK